MSTDFRALCAELTQQLDDALDFTVSSETRLYMKALVVRARAALAEPVPEDDARAVLAESATSDYKVASEDTMRRIRSTTKRWRINVIISTNDSSIDTRIGCGIWKCLDIEREILESVSLPEYLPAIKETTNG